MLEISLKLVSNFIITLCFSLYIITVLQWYNYKFERVLFHYTKPLWHLYYVIIPLIYISMFQSYVILFVGAILYSVAIILWQKKLDKKLVFTNRVKRFFLFLAAFFVVSLFFKFEQIAVLQLIFSVGFALCFSFIYEYVLALKFKKEAKIKINNIPNLKIILITASFGKTSMKNFLYDMLKNDFNVYKTPRSVNTLSGIIRDINENLSFNTQIYIAEAGARLKGDIKDITEFLEPHFVIVGEIGDAHIEYFKSVENVRATKLEALNSSRIKKAFLHSSTLKNSDKNIVIYDILVKNIVSNLDGVKFDILYNAKELHFSSNLLGGFNAYNLCACILLAIELGVNEQTLQNTISKIKSVEHRLERIEAGGKIIIDDSFNGNLKGMKESYELVNSYSGKKVLLTPGIVEGKSSLNEELSKKINEVFDIVVITNSLNEKSLTKFLVKPEVIVLKDRSQMQDFLANHTASGDLILFSNDAPNFI
ncbi:Mur ligase family protein [Campylobacter fetus]|uniref:Mur ligase family protein n=1 Tax=Campylobacter fetus TaxID=196 RepID=UPI000409E081|nr:UDP-N-acetylmuramoyl-tripeptide--D-alanyl-D-alanine ligase [Campylobacter fetus]AGZ81671.2 D-alanyl-D-alanine-adding enzyme [Campylobacter fetus subsp. testudinum 03-427]AJB45411.1 UDP-N-acetylmuramoylalanyl-D-glutamyl-2, 6-diaminopimelate--D-alanyl-D-alanine ligase [Campylobacter fetus subsp. testudinum]EAI4321350.1 UDP-N-acetylmuramoyl-tripeptide--D-alanyl-D-alanine ligase [Campylobacter fetus]EAI4390607.1 UDP-N-acetylmuramoyl-tripeptide--D-alanyl-D-alanine ligase [Campylobacter fetus]OCS